MVVDILARLGDAIDFDDLNFQSVELEGRVIRVATPRTLYRMKRGTARAVDRADASGED